LPDDEIAQCLAQDDYNDSYYLGVDGTEEFAIYLAPVGKVKKD
jgi:hypothetical protein